MIFIRINSSGPLHLVRSVTWHNNGRKTYITCCGQSRKKELPFSPIVGQEAERICSNCRKNHNDTDP